MRWLRAERAAEPPLAEQPERSRMAALFAVIAPLSALVLPHAPQLAAVATFAELGDPPAHLGFRNFTRQNENFADII